MTPGQEPYLRADKWLWYARFFKSRSIAAQAVSAGRVRVNGRKLSRASASVRVGDVLTVTIGRHVKVAQLLALGARRGPAAEAQTLYLILDES
ncbi:MAG: RNA-binding S4 domain-containing protein [Pseudomonadota bacterium]